MRVLKQNTTPKVTFLMVDSADSKTGKTGLSPIVYLSKDGANGLAVTNAVSNVDATNNKGWYKVTLTTTETDTIGDLILSATASGADPTDRLFVVETADLSDVDGEIDSIKTSVGTPSLSLAADIATRSTQTSVNAIPTTPLLAASYTAPPTVVQVRQEIDTNSTKLDAAISSRMASFTYTAPDNTSITNIKTKTDYLPSATAGNTGGVSIVGSQMDLVDAPNVIALTAIANEVERQIIDDTDTEKVLKAITDKIAAANPSLGDLTLASIASSVRTELTTELARIDAAISSRLASSGYTAPANSDITAIKAKTDNLPASPASTSDVTVTVNPTLTTEENTQLMSIPTNPLLANDIRLDHIDADISSRLSALETLTESYAAKGEAPTLSQVLFMIWGMLSEKEKTAATTISTKRLDNGSISMTFTVDNEDKPTLLTRAA
jgi:hypothetical protein